MFNVGGQYSHLTFSLARGHRGGVRAAYSAGVVHGGRAADWVWMALGTKYNGSFNLKLASLLKYSLLPKSSETWWNNICLG